MYAWIWRRLPFGLPGKIIGSLLLAAGFTALLWFFVFPWAEPLLPFDDVQVTQEGGVPGDPGSVDPGAPGLDDHDIPYDTSENNPAPSATSNR
ncbi:hypothetical protein SAMN05444365_1011062 [Micromonospora pattaloongensis]|uniref:Uncharacterized protein n=1 Tax=Micromonospora pattaloongensis TaxID=405436 RepID=A0A1H3I068_9ACTN|nr:hypothetical protein [Micromonospora pattaloongensis]SDY21083.1 hypothetical protein SAMN05444365_1011062 [Micromonospora pattaloongensis]